MIGFVIAVLEFNMITVVNFFVCFHTRNFFDESLKERHVFVYICVGEFVII